MSGGDWKEMYGAVQKGDFELVKYHIKNGVDPNYQHPEILSTPLVAAILEGYTDIALYLLKKNADPKLRSHFDNLTPLEAAIQRRDTAVLKALKILGIQMSFFQKISKLLKSF